MVRALLILVVFIPLSASGQFAFRMDNSVPVTDSNGQPLADPWAGGLNAAQFNTMDLNNDSFEDLVLFDRMANKLSTFLNVNNQYRHAPEYEILFPGELQDMLLLRDFNCDGKKDIFTHDIQGIRVYENVSDQEKLAWRHFRFFIQAGLPKRDVIITKGFSNEPINIAIQFDDLPAIADADGDGDLDLFNMRFPNSETVEYHRNFSIERFGTCDSLVFERVTTTWGGIRECSCGTFAFNNDPCTNVGGRKKHAGGKSLLALDANGDGTTDLLFSESECSQLFLLPNEGTADEPVINSFTSFPENAPVDFDLFPAAYYEDADFDGIKDLISSPNLFEKEHNEINLEQSAWLYKNTGTNEDPSFSFVKNNFLQNNMIDVGDNAVPAFADLEGDGDQDLFISRNTTANGTTSGIFLFENIGSSTDPQFRFLTDDYQNLSSSGLYNIKIQFTDVDQNNTRDLSFTATSFASGSTQLYYYANKSVSALDFSGQVLTQANFNLSFDENVHVTDVNQDGQADILIGKNNGAVQYWKNSGGMNFTLEDNEFLSLGSSVFRQNISLAVGDLDTDGKEDVVLGDQGGTIGIISDFRNQSNAATELVFNPLLNNYVDHNLGGRIWPAIVNLGLSENPSLVVGNILGGLHILKNEGGFSLSPNPVVKGRNLNLRLDDNVSLTIYSSSGVLVAGPVVIPKGENIEGSIPTLAAGFYIFRFQGQKKSFSRKVVIL